MYYEKNRDKILQQQNDRYNPFKDLVGSYVELESRLKAMEDNIKN